MRIFHAKPAFDFLQLSLTALGLLVAVTNDEAQPVGLDTNRLPPSPAAVTTFEERPLDPVEQFIVDTIGRLELKLTDPALDAATRSNLTTRISVEKAELIKHRLQRREREAFWEALEQQRKEIHGRAKNALLTSATPELMDAIALLRAKHAEILADRETNAQLWRNVSKARDAKNRELIAKTENELAVYLTKKLESIDHKQYPQGMSLAEVLEYYKKHPLAKPVDTKPTER